MMQKGLLRLMALLLAAMPLLGVFAADKADAAATSRVAVIKSLKGTVQVKKAGGSKQFKAFAKMSLNEGDVLSTGDGSSAELQFSNGTSSDDQISVSEKTTLSFSKLSDRSGTRTKVSMFNGSVWVDVKSIATKNDEFTLETPTAIMGVRGTHFGAFVDPVTGTTQLGVFAGVVRSKPSSLPQSSSVPGNGFVDVYPAQQILMSQFSNPANLPGQLTPTDLERMAANASPEIIASILRNADQIRNENERMIQNLQNSFNNQVPNAGANQNSLTILTPEQLQRVQQNIANLLGAFVRTAVETNRTTDQQVQDILRQSGQSLDYKNASLQLTDDEKKKLEQLRQQEELKRKEEELKRKQEDEQRVKDQLDKLNELKKKKDEENKRVLEEKRKKAEEEYLRQLDDADKQRFKENKRNLEPSSSSSSVSGGGTNSSPIPRYSVTYNGNGHTGGTVPIDGNTYAHGQTVTVFGNTGELVKEGYTFAGWNTKADGSGTDYSSGAMFAMLADNMTLYAKWNPQTNPLELLELFYYTAPPSASPKPAAEKLDFSLTTTSYTVTLPYVHTEIVLKARGKNADDHIAVTSNGVPVEIRMHSEIPGAPVEFRVPLYVFDNVVKIDVYSAGGGSVQTVTLHIFNSDLPEGLSFQTSNDVAFTRVGKDHFAAEIPSEAGSFDFSVNFGESYSSLKLYGRYGSLLPPVESTSSEISWSLNPSSGDYESYELEVVKNSKYYYFTFDVNKGVAAPKWTNGEWIASNPPLVIHTLSGNEIGYEWSTEDSALHASVGVEEYELVLNPYSDLLNIVAVWDDTLKWAQNEYSCEYDNEPLGFCLPLSQADNMFKVYVTDPIGMNAFVYTLIVHRSELPTGVLNWSVGYAADATASPSPVPLQTNSHSMPWYDASYYSTSTVTSNVYASLDLTIDPEQVSMVVIQKPDNNDRVERNVAEFPDAHIPFTAGELNLTPGQAFNEFELKLYDGNDCLIGTYQIVIVVGEIPPEPLNGELLDYPMEFTGDRTRSVFVDTAQEDLVFRTFYGEVVSINGQMLPLVDMSYRRVDNLLAGEIYPFTVLVYNEYHIGEPTEYTVTFYNAPALPALDLTGVQKRNDSGLLVDLTNIDAGISYQFRANMSGSLETAIRPAVPSGAVILGVYDDQNDPIGLDTNGDYPVHLIENGRKAIYVVVRNGSFVKSIQVLLDHI